MPIYEYECIPHQHRFEVLQKISEGAIQKCQVCGGKVRKLISPTAFQLKGGGWFKDGYGSVKPCPKETKTECSKQSTCKSEEKSKSATN